MPAGVIEFVDGVAGATCKAIGDRRSGLAVRGSGSATQQAGHAAGEARRDAPHEAVTGTELEAFAPRVRRGRYALTDFVWNPAASRAAVIDSISAGTSAGRSATCCLISRLIVYARNRMASM